jgi:hypothetical protein
MDHSQMTGAGDGTERRHLLKCKLWAGTGVLWTISGGVPRSSLPGKGAMAATNTGGDLTFMHMARHLTPSFRW